MTHQDIAVICSDASCHRLTDWLAFAGCEAELTARLWGSRARSVHVCASAGSATPAHEAVHAALSRSRGAVLIGHGIPGLNGGWHQSGLLLGEDSLRRPVVLTGDEVASANSVRQVFVSACVLGRTRSFLGESLGMLAALFDADSSVQTAIGAVHPVYDFEAMLIALAFHHDVARHDTGKPGPTAADAEPRPRLETEPGSWREHFVRVQLGIEAGNWPEAFPEWLQAHLAKAIDRAVAGTPERRDEWYNALQGHSHSDAPGVFERMGLQPMEAGRWGLWLPDLERLASQLRNGGVPAYVRAAARSYVVLGD